MQTFQAFLYLLLLAGSTAGQMWLWRSVQSGGASSAVVALLVVNYGLLIFLYVLIGLLMHEAGHAHLTRRRWLNATLGQLAALLLQLSFTLYRHVHWSHHRAVNVPEDLELLSENSQHLPPRRRRRALLGLMFLGGVERGRAFKQQVRDPSARLAPAIRGRARVEYALVQAAGLVGSVLWIWKLGVASWLLSYVGPLLAGSWWFTWIQLCEHYAMPPGAGPEATRDVLPRSRGQALLYRAMFNVNYHGIHHARPEIPGDHLAQAHAIWVRELEQSGQQASSAFGSYLEIARQIVPRIWSDARVPAQRASAPTGETAA